MKTAELNKLVFAYILDAIDNNAYEVICNSDKDKLQFLADTFKSEYCSPDNLKYYGSYQETLENWIMGLPSCFNIAFENYRILEIAKQWGSIPQDATEKQEDKILANWFNFIAAKTLILMRKNGVLIN